MWWPGHDRAPGQLWRWTLDPTTGSVTEEQLDARPADFPRIDDRLTGTDIRFGHVTSLVVDGGQSVLRRYDLHTGATREHDFSPRHIPGEAVFVPAQNGEGWLLTFVYDRTTDRSDLVIFDASDVTAAPVATVHLPHRVPIGFHGNWLPEG